MSALIGRHGGGGHGGGHGGGRRFFGGGGGGGWGWGWPWYGYPYAYAYPAPYAPPVAFDVEESEEEVVGGFWSALEGAYRTASSPVTWFNKKVAQTIQRVPGLKAAVTTAATAVATAYGGPAAGALAGRLAGPIIDSSAQTGGDPTRLFDRAKQSAHQQSGGDRRAVQAVAHAQSAITQTAAAYTLQALSRDAASGHPESMQQLGQIQQAAQAGDPSAVRAMQILSEIQRVEGSPPAAAAMPPPAAAVGYSLGDSPGIDDLRELALTSAARVRGTHGFGEAVVFVVSPRHGTFAVPFDSRMEAVRYLHRVDPRAISYIASVDVSDPGSPFLLTERSFGGAGLVAATAPVTPGGSGSLDATTSGFWPYLGYGLLGAFAGYGVGTSAVETARRVAMSVAERQRDADAQDWRTLVADRDRAWQDLIAQRDQSWQALVASAPGGWASN